MSARDRGLAFRPQSRLGQRQRRRQQEIAGELATLREAGGTCSRCGSRESALGVVETVSGRVAECLNSAACAGRAARAAKSGGDEAAGLPQSKSDTRAANRAPEPDADTVARGRQ